ncbi:MAG: hypothetical protein N4A63_01115 [Vallitalea sp.]|jgi:hypothetical protein|nr:hypothetical protein [Vallitalea sp.]
MKKKRIMAMLLGLLLCVSFVGCGNTSNKIIDGENNTSTDENDKKYEYSSIDVLMMMFDKVGAKPYETIKTLNENYGEQVLNYKNMTNENNEDIKVEGYISGASTRPMMMPSTQNITVLQFEDNSNFEKYKEGLKGIMYSEVCVIPAEESVHVVENGNFLCYIAVESNEGDKGDEFEKAFKDLDLTVEPNYNDDITLDKAMTIYNEYKEDYEISEINMDPMAVETINPSYPDKAKYDFTKDDIEEAYFVRSQVDYTQVDKPLAFSSYIVKVKNHEKINLVKEALENALEAENNKYIFYISEEHDVKVDIDGNYVILTAKKVK